MSVWRNWPYPFPPDDGLEWLWEVLDRVPMKCRADLDWTVTDKFVVAVADVKAAIYLRLACDGGRLMGVDGVSMLEQHEVLVASHERAECEALLRDNCPTQAEWFSIVVLHTRTDSAKLAFDEAYRAVMVPSA